MATTHFIFSPFKHFDPLYKTQTIKPCSTSRARASVRAAKHEADGRDFFGGRPVDEGLIVLRRRIHEMKMSETNEEAPGEWMDWEKELYHTSGYDSMICDAIGQLQACLMETRPSLALGIIALVALSVPFSTAVVVYDLLEWIKVIVHGIR